MQMKHLRSGSILMLVLGLAGCGSDGGNGGGILVQPVQGKVTQGPVKQATIFADRLGLGAASVQDSDEVSTTTDNAGNFTLNVPVNYGAYRLISQGGTDTVTGKAAMQMVAPAGAANVTPLTTLVALAPADKQAELKTKLQTATGMSFDADISTATPAALLVVKSVETAVETLGKTLDPAGDKILKPELYDIQQKTLAALATTFASSTGSLTNVDALKADITTAVTAALGTIEAAHTDIAVADESAVASAVSSTVTSVATTISSDLVFRTNTTVTETSVFTSDAQTAINTAITAGVDAGRDEVTVTPKSDNTAPRAVYSSPSLTGIAIDAGISVTFSEALTASTVTSTNFKVNGVSGTVTYDAARFVATFKPTSALAYSTTYTVTLTNGITDLAGNQLPATTLTFTTVDRPLTGSTGSTGSTGTGANF